MTTATRLKQVLAVLKRSEATLRDYAATTRLEEEQAVFREAYKSIESIVGELEGRVGQMEMEEPQFKGY